MQRLSARTMRGSDDGLDAGLEEALGEVPRAGPISRTVSVGLRPAFSTMESTSAGFRRMCCPLDFSNGIPPCSRAPPPPPPPPPPAPPPCRFFWIFPPAMVMGSRVPTPPPPPEEELGEGGGGEREVAARVWEEWKGGVLAFAFLLGLTRLRHV